MPGGVLVRGEFHKGLCGRGKCHVNVGVDVHVSVGVAKTVAAFVSNSDDMNIITLDDIHNANGIEKWNIFH